MLGYLLVLSLFLAKFYSAILLKGSGFLSAGFNIGFCLQGRSLSLTSRTKSRGLCIEDLRGRNRSIRLGQNPGAFASILYPAKGSSNLKTPSSFVVVRYKLLSPRATTSLETIAA